MRKFATKKPIWVKMSQTCAFSMLKIHQFKESTPPSVVAVVTNKSYV